MLLSHHLAYDSYPNHITNNQSGYIILEAGEEQISIYGKNESFAKDYGKARNVATPYYSDHLQAFLLEIIQT